MTIIEVDPHLVVGDVETDLLAVVEDDPHLVVDDVETDLLAVVEDALTLLLVMLRHISWL